MLYFELKIMWLLCVLLLLAVTLYIGHLIKETLSLEQGIMLAQDDSLPKFYITGDKHRNFEDVEQFVKGLPTRKNDVLIILGDAGINYYEDERDEALKTKLSELEITLFCIHGNKEKRPQMIDTYVPKEFCGGTVYFEPKFSNLLFAVDGEVYCFDHKEYLVIGGAHSIDKQRCIREGLPYWENESPDDQIKKQVEQTLSLKGNRIYGIMTHTCPMKYLPDETFHSNRKDLAELDIDRSIEKWFDQIENQTQYQVWYCGHYHVDKSINRFRIMHRDIIPLHLHDF